MAFGAGNLAKLSELVCVGPVSARWIGCWSTRRGSFASVEQLCEVDGSGASRLAKLFELVRT